MIRYSIIGLFGNSFLRFIRPPDTSDSRLAPVTVSLRRPDSLSVFTKSTLLSIKS